MSNAMLLYAHMSDNELIDKVKSGNKPCFEVLVRRHSQSLYRVGRMHGISHNDVEEILQHTHKTGFQRLQRLDKKYPFRLYLLKLMIQNCLQKMDEGNGDPKQFEPASRVIDDIVLGERVHTVNSATNALQERIDSLPLPLRSVFVLTEIEGLSIKETAELLFISENLAKTRLTSAKEVMDKSAGHFYYADVYPFHKSCCNMLIDMVMAQVDAETYHIEKALLPRC